jgi:hypothetical protein
MAAPRDAKQRAQVLDAVGDRIGADERVVAVLPFASTPKRPKGPMGKVREGIYTTYRRYRPLVLTSRRLFVVDAGRTPYPRGVLAEFPRSDVDFVDVVPDRFNQQRLQLDLPGVGIVPFLLGRFDLAELPELQAALERR